MGLLSLKKHRSTGFTSQEPPTVALHGYDCPFEHPCKISPLSLGLPKCVVKNTWAANKADRLVRHMGIVCKIAKQNRIMLGPISELGAKLGKCESKDQNELTILLLSLKVLCT